MNRTVTGILDGKPRGSGGGYRGKAVGDSGERHTGCGDLRIAKALALQAHGQAEDGAISG